MQRNSQVCAQTKYGDVKGRQCLYQCEKEVTRGELGIPTGHKEYAVNGKFNSRFVGVFPPGLKSLQGWA